MSLLSFRDVGFAYDKDIIFEKINLAIEPGDVLCLIGPNGCGKTTLLDCAIGALKVNRGTVIVNGRDMSAMNPRETAKVLAYVPQVHERAFPYTVLEIVLMGRASYTTMFSAPSLQDKDIAEEALEMVGMGAFKQRPYTRLSGGEAQMVMLARALAQMAPVLVLDEPTAHLDFNNEIIFLDTVIRLVKEKKIAIFMATHYPNHAFTFHNSGLATRVAIMHEKSIVDIGAPELVLSESNLQKVFNVDAKILSYAHMNKRYNYILPLGSASLQGSELLLRTEPFKAGDGRIA